MLQTPHKISIIVPIYNTEQYLRRCIDSILTQAYTNFELLLIDDGSTDDSGKICDEYAAKNSCIRVFHKENEGVTKARELGVNESEGEYIMFVDSDDCLCPDALKASTNSIIHTNGADIIIFGKASGIITKEEYIKCLLKNQISWCCWGKLYKKEIFSTSPFNIPRYFNIGEDLMMQLKLSKNIQHDIHCVEECIYTVIENPNSVTRSRTFSIEYETKFINEITRIVEILEVDSKSSLYELKINSLHGLIKSGTKVSYKVQWIQDLKKEHRIYGNSIRDLILLYIPNNTLCKVLIRIKDFLGSNLFHK